MNDLAKVTREGGVQLIALPEGYDVSGDALRVRRVGRTLVLEPIERGADSTERVPPGSYTPATLPPLSEGARKILASLDAVAPLADVRGGQKSAQLAGGIGIEDEGIGVDVSDEGLPGLDPGD